MLHRLMSLILVISVLQPHWLGAQDREEVAIPALLQPSLYTKIAQEFAAVPDEGVIGAGMIAPEANGFDVLTEGQKRSILFNLFAEYSVSNFRISPFVVATDDIRADLEVFKQASLFRRIKRTSTAFGDVVLAHTLATPTYDQVELRRRQAIEKKLVEDQELFKALDEALAEIKKAEATILSFFSPQNDHIQQALAPLYFDKTLWGEFPGFSPEWDQSEKALLISEAAQRGLLLVHLASIHGRTTNAFKYIPKKLLLPAWGTFLMLRFNPGLFKNIVGFATILAMFPGIPLLLAYRYLWRKKPFEWSLSGAIKGLGSSRADTTPHPEPQPTTGFFGWLHNKYQAGSEWNANVSQNLINYEAAAFLPLEVYGQVKSLSTWQTNLRFVQERLMHLGKTVRKLRTVAASLLKNQEFVAMVPEALPLIHLFEQGGASEDMQSLLEKLESNTFKGSPSLWSNFARIAATNKLMEATKYDWVEIFEAIGHLDVYLSVAKLMKEFKDKKVTYCFADYVAAEAPVLTLENFWDPLLDADCAVPNSLVLGTPTRNIILTGPNTGGKSTIIKGIMLDVLCAQTLGIVPATACKLTPFAAFNTYSRVEDDIENGLSLFAAEVKRANSLKQKIVNLPKNKFGLTINDEMFRGTAPDNAERLSYKYALDFGACQNSICLMATHYPKLIDLEAATGGLYHNYKVEIERLPDGTLKRNYKLIRGSTTQNVAEDILREQGLR